MKRSRDWIWVAGFTLIIFGFTGIGVLAFARPITDLSSVHGRCHIGIPRHTIIPLVTFDVFLNILLTFVFVYLLSPLIRSGKLSFMAFPASRLTKCLGHMCGRPKSKNSLIQASEGNRTMVKRIERLLLRTFIGSFLVTIPTISNMAVLGALKGRELGWVCLITCSVDGSSAGPGHSSKANSRCSYVDSGRLSLVNSRIQGH